MTIKTKTHKTVRATVIIGAGFGDEGKGLLTDRTAARFGADCIVARFNGGAQAGHTVVLPDGRRHIHSHFGSGTPAGAATFLSKYFVSNPLLFWREKTALENQGFPPPTVFADQRGLVSTPYDMLINQFIEKARGGSRHGSCGIGFGETIERCLRSRYTTRVADLNDAGKMASVLDDIRQNWVPERLAGLGIETISGELMDLLRSDQLKNDFIASAERFYREIRPARPEILRSRKGVILEGAQGLLLDQDGGWFPHVTRSNTGLCNAIGLAEEAGLESLDVIYATRAYATRHGAGPLPHELAAAPYDGIKDPTNIPNPFQGSLRFGWLDLDLLKKTINADLRRYARRTPIKIGRQLAVTCLDQLDQKAFFVSHNKLRHSSPEGLAFAAGRATGIKNVLVSRGPTRQTVSKLKTKAVRYA
ncbi:MAG: adenylosuccinate synthetase [Pyrinomonadaceae bacterium]